MDVHVFKGRDGVYGNTRDNSGDNLPTEYGPWTFEKTLKIEPGEVARIAVDTDEMLGDINEKGYHLSKPKIVVGERTV